MAEKLGKTEWGSAIDRFANYIYEFASYKLITLLYRKPVERRQKVLKAG